LAVLKCVKIREFYEFFKIRKMRILELCSEPFILLLFAVSVSHCVISVFCRYHYLTLLTLYGGNWVAIGEAVQFMAQCANLMLTAVFTSETS